MRLKRKSKLVSGVGINDADYEVQKYAVVSGKRKRTWVCPYYNVWKSMITRCYSRVYQSRQPTYKNCTVCNEWLTFSNFKKWMEQQDHKGKYLDKDVLSAGNRVYSSEHCVFVTRNVNNFVTEGNHGKRPYLIGVCFLVNKKSNSYQSQCKNPFNQRTRGHLGYYSSEIQAHLAWKYRKRELAIQLANSVYVTDERVAQALINRYQGDGVYIDAVNNNIPVEEFLLNREQYLSKV